MSAPWEGDLYHKSQAASRSTKRDIVDVSGNVIAWAVDGDVAPELVHRANAYPKLVEANEVALAALEQMWKDYMSDRHPRLEQINDAMKGLRAALASTREEG